MNTEQHTHPRFRTDLVAQPLDESGQRFVDVTDPDSGNTFRFYEVEYSIACAMDGSRDLEGLVSWAQVELGLEPSHDELQTVISTLDDLGYLAGAGNGAGDVELAPGITGGSHGAAVPGGAAAVGSADVELGAPGKSPIARPRSTPAAAEDVELGLPGSSGPRAAVPATTSGSAAADEEASFADILGDGPVSSKPSTAMGSDEPGLVMEFEAPTPPPAEVPIPQATLRPRTQADSDDDGPTQLPTPQPHDFDDDEVSVDLSDHLSIGADDVKEAVRQSKVMQAVSVPPELLDELEHDRGDEATKDFAATPAPTTAEVVGKAKDSVPQPPPASEAKEPGGAPIALPDKRAKAKPVPQPSVEPPPSKPEPASSGSLTILLLLLAIVAVGAAAGWYYMTQIKGKDTPASQRPGGPGVGSAAAAQAPTARPAPPEPTATLAVGVAEPVALTAAADAKIGWVEEAGTEIDEGAVVVKLSGYERHEKKAMAFASREQHYQEKLEAAQAAGDQGKIEYNTKKVQQKQAGAAEEQAKMEEFFLKAPAAGTVEPVAQAGGWVKAGDELVRIAQGPVTTAVFSGIEGQFAVGEPLQVNATDGSASMDCTVTAFEPRSLTVSCPAGDGAAPAGATVTLGD